MIWFEDTYQGDLLQKLQVSRLLYRKKTEYQDLVIFENPRCGRVLALDGAIQTTEADEFVYHEMLVHPALIAHSVSRRVLIIGGGDGGALRRVLAHRDVEHVTLVEIDRTVVDLCREYLPSICENAFDDPRVELVVQDGSTFVEQTTQRYDVVIVDSSDPIGPATRLFEQPFYRDCKRCLREGGILVTQNGVPFTQPDELKDSMQFLRNQFADVSCYLAPIPMYNGGHMAFGWASDVVALRCVEEGELASRIRECGLVTRYYNAAVHRASFALPEFIRELVG